MSEYQRTMRNLVLSLRNACELYVLYDYNDSAKSGQPKQLDKILDLAEQIRYYKKQNEQPKSNFGPL